MVNEGRYSDGLREKRAIDRSATEHLAHEKRAADALFSFGLSDRTSPIGKAKDQSSMTSTRKVSPWLICSTMSSPSVTFPKHVWLRSRCAVFSRLWTMKN